MTAALLLPVACILRALSVRYVCVAHANNSRTERIVLTGFMGSGKSTIGKLLAQYLGWAFVDLDAAVEERCGLSVPQIFAEYGEQRFRSEESAALLPLLQSSCTVIALGGGAPESPLNRKMLQEAAATAVVYLQASFDTLHARCADQARSSGMSTRPLLADRNSALLRFSSRQQFYEAIATVRLDTTDLSPEEAVSTVIALLP